MSSSTTLLHGCMSLGPVLRLVASPAKPLHNRRTSCNLQTERPLASTSRMRACACCERVCGVAESRILFQHGGSYGRAGTMCSAAMPPAVVGAASPW